MKITRENLLWIRYCFFPAQPHRGSWELIKYCLVLGLPRSRPWDKDSSSRRVFENWSWETWGWEYGVKEDGKAAHKGWVSSLWGHLELSPAGNSGRQSRPLPGLSHWLQEGVGLSLNVSTLPPSPPASCSLHYCITQFCNSIWVLCNIYLCWDFLHFHLFQDNL